MRQSWFSFVSSAGLFGLLLFLSVNASAERLNLNIVSDSSWKSSATFIEGWEQTSFNDMAWSAARVYPVPSHFSPDLLIPGTWARPIWHDPLGTSNGTNGANEVLRKSFNLTMASDSLPAVLGQALINVDDDYVFLLTTSWHSRTTTEDLRLFRISSILDAS